MPSEILLDLEIIKVAEFKFENTVYIQTPTYDWRKIETKK